LQRAQQAGVQNIANAAISLGTGLAMTDFSERERKQENPLALTPRVKLSDKNLPGLKNIPQPEVGGLSETMIQRTPENVFDAQARIREQRNEKLGSSFDMGAQSGAVKRRLMPSPIKDLIDTDPSILGDENFPEYTGMRDLPKNTSRSNTIVLNPDGGYDYDETKLSLQGFGEKMKEVPTGKRISRTPEYASDRSKSVGNARYMQSLGLEGLDKYERPLEVIEFEDQFEEETFKKGGKKYRAKKTPGKFSHKTNPLHIVSNNGAKVGEMTGGEYIFNPKQAASLRKHSKSGSSPLHKFVRQMLSKSQFK
jgi:hypothetical protein